MPEIKIISEQKCFGGVQGFYSHQSSACNGEMKFGVFVPPAAKAGKVATLTYLAGLTCTEETFVIKAGAQRLAAELGLMLIAPDTSPRNQNIEGEDDDWDFGTGAGFYLDATEELWAKAYNMQTYVVEELRHIVAENFSADLSRHGIFGHSMGGHGALTLHLKHPKTYKSASAFAPICAPMSCPWGQKAFKNYLGGDKQVWEKHDASQLVATQPSKALLLVDQGLADNFLESELHPHLLEQAAKGSGQKLTLRRHEGYDHSYYFIQTFMEDHLRHHAKELTN
ncbi:MAG: S-formylglutathione hydrolase [Gammaproteobacteria bacterium]|nr:S-formylglutathione hydrolase [Gammaproteobacteria bacterium]